MNGALGVADWIILKNLFTEGSLSPTSKEQKSIWRKSWLNIDFRFSLWIICLFDRSEFALPFFDLTGRSRIDLEKPPDTVFRRTELSGIEAARSSVL